MTLLPTVLKSLDKKTIILFSLIITGLIIAIGLRFESESAKVDELLTNQELTLQNQALIYETLNQSEANSENINKTQAALLAVNENLLTVYTKILLISNTIDNNTDSNRNMTVQNRQMISFLRDNFDEQFIGEYTTNNAYQLQILDNILSKINNMSTTINNMSRQ